MADLCIVCLGELRRSTDVVKREEEAQEEEAAPPQSSSSPLPPPLPRTTSSPPPPSLQPATSVPDPKLSHHHHQQQSLHVHPNTVNRIHEDEEAIAHLLPCKHDLHNVCLKPWVERANSCPICRATFHLVELSESIGGPVIDTYAVADKVQEAEIDASMVVDDELFAVEPWEPCLICGSTHDTHEVMYCDGCDRAVHVFCAGFEDSPEVWYCETCLVDLETETGLPGLNAAVGRRRQQRPRPTSSSRSRRGGNNDAIWARVWQEVSRRLDLDLDFPFDDETGDLRTEEQRREFARWQRRFDVVNQSGAVNRLRGIAQARLAHAEPRPVPESQEELRAWNAFDKARESHEAPAAIRRRKRNQTDSPASPRPEENAEQPQQKRPRLRRPPRSVHERSQQPVAESSNAATQRANGVASVSNTPRINAAAARDDNPNFLSALLSEVGDAHVGASSPGASDHHAGHFSPRESSPMHSPITSGHATPREQSMTPPHINRRSPPLSSVILPMPSPPINPTFSPFSPAVQSEQHNSPTDGRRNGDHNVEPSSPNSRNLSYSAKEEIQRMVKLSLGSRYRDKQITKDQYTDINRDVSRLLYELVGDASALSNRTERIKWQEKADQEVTKAVAALASGVS